MSDFFDRLEELQKDSELSLLELEFGRFLKELNSEPLQNVIIAGMVCVKNQINGHICCSIDDILHDSTYQKLLIKGTNSERLITELTASKVIGNPGEKRPLILDNGNLYLQKFWKFEQELADFLVQKSEITHVIDVSSKQFVQEFFKGKESKTSDQKKAVLLALVKDLVIISGGPGTGKTFTVRKIIEALHQQRKTKNFALATPTGKAAQRLNESLQLSTLPVEIKPAITIHKLLGARGVTGTFKYNENTKLPYDVLIIDEASMLDINLWIRLIRATAQHTKLILLGDKNQLASVEAGSILGDICSKSNNEFSSEISEVVFGEETSSNRVKSINDSIIELTKSYRFKEGSGIKELSDLINSGNSEGVLSMLKDKSTPEISFSEPSNEVIGKIIEEFIVTPFLENSKTGFNFNSFNQYQILCALRKSPFGVEYINNTSEKAIKKELGIRSQDEWYEGRPIIITRNNGLLKIRNGEIGICRKNQSAGQYEIILEGREDAPISVSRIQDYEPAFAITVHKSQGSEYDHVSIILSNQPNALLSRQLLYTAVTRGRKSVLVIVNESVISSTIKQTVARRSGLKKKIWGL